MKQAALQKYLSGVISEEEYIVEAEVSKEDIQSALFDFFTKNPKPTDKQVHALSEKLGIDEHVFEQYIYELVGILIADVGKDKDIPDDKFDAKQLKRGVEVEKEHTSNPIIAKWIAKTHLRETPNYYIPFLDDMEKAAKKASAKKD